MSCFHFVRPPFFPGTEGGALILLGFIVVCSFVIVPRLFSLFETEWRGRLF